jgi:CubicO group peptidase (beta-lactamase class C family)
MERTFENFTEIDELFSKYFDQDRTPGLVYGITEGPNLIHCKTLGHKSIGEATPDSNTCFRVASLTKSFTAAAALMLRDQGILSFEIPAKKYVPELAKLETSFADAPELTLHHLLSMSSGLPTDNEWADRLEDISDQQLQNILVNNARFNFIPGTNYEYSNLGYAIVALAIKNVTGKKFIDFVKQEIFRPLELNATTFDYKDATNFALGYVKREKWELETLTGPGAFSAIGGVTTNIHDLTKWNYFLASAFDVDSPNVGPISKSTRREMQQVQQVITQIREPNVELTYVGVNGYGYGLRIEEDLDYGKFVGHSGGYPGYGAHMRWHPSTGLGVIALANGRYASPALACIPGLRYLISQKKLKPFKPTLKLLEIQNLVNKLINNWDDGIADKVFGANMDQDHPRLFRMSQIEIAKSSVTYDAEKAKVLDTTSRNDSNINWKLSAVSGALDITVYLNPDFPVSIQTLEVLPVGLLNT